MDFMKTAIKEAIKGVNKGDGGPFGAVIIKDGKVIAKAHNTVLSTNDPTAHAEITVIRKASKKLNTFDLSECELYTSSYPCPMCLSAILWANIKVMYYHFNESYANDACFRDEKIHNCLNGKEDLSALITIEKKEVKLKEKDNPFTIWKAKENKKVY